MEGKFSVNVFENFMIYLVRLSSLTRTSRKWCVPFSTAENVRKLILIRLLALITLLQQAKSRGVSTSVVGLVFATYPLLVFICAPICGLLVSNFMRFPIPYLQKDRPKNYLLTKLNQLIKLYWLHFIAMVTLPTTGQETV